MGDESSIEQRIQDALYAFPYHYIPTLENGRFSLIRYWGMSGLRYMGRIQFILAQLESLPFDSLVDIGCGDGRLLREIAKRYPEKNLLGVDYSKRAIQLARAMNPAVNYKVVDIAQSTEVELFEVATLIEVIEHIPPQEVEQFLIGVAHTLQHSGLLILTVPHTNMRLMKRHHQHFTSTKIVEMLSSCFEDIDITFLDPESRTMRLVYRLLGGNGEHFLINNRFLLSWFYELYITRYLRTTDEEVCKRIAVTCRKR